MNSMSRRVVCFAIGLVLVLALQPGVAQQPQATKPVKVTIQEEKAELIAMPLDPAVRIEHQYTGNMQYGVTAEGKMLTCGAGAAHTLFKIDNQILFPDIVTPPEALPGGPNSKKRNGIQSTWKHGDLKVTQVIEIIAGRPYDKNVAQKRRMDCLLIKYVIENTGAGDKTISVRQHIDTLVVQNDGAIFASPSTHPNKLLDGVAFKGKDIPDFIEILENPDLKNPGFKGIFTFKLGKLQGPDRIVLTSLRAGGQWDVAAIPAMGDSACAFFWENVQVKGKSKHEVGFAYGQSLAVNPENEGKVHIQFGGNFEPNKAFTVTAYVEDPLEGQALTLLLPKGVERLDDRDTQTVPQPTRDGQSVVMWRCRVQQLGTFPIRIRSSNGVTETRTVTVAPAE